MNAHRPALLALLLAVALASAPDATACSCVDALTHDAPVAALQKSSLVVTAEVLSVTRPEQSAGCGGGDSSGYIVADMRVDEAFKGAEPGEVIEVRTPNDSCRVRLDKGDMWLLFTNQRAPGLRYCDLHSTSMGSTWSYGYCEPVDGEEDGGDGCEPGFVEVWVDGEAVLQQLRRASP